MIKEPADLAKIFGSKGVSDKNTIVVYDGGSQKYSTRVYWILKYLGAEDVKILHKDMNAWKKVRIPLTRMIPAIKATSFAVNVNASICVDMVYVKAAKGKAKIIDTLTADEYKGTSTDPVSPGHIPESININYLDILTDAKSFKSKAEIEGIANKNGITTGDEIIVYCKTGISAAVLYVALKDICGYNNVKIYEGGLAQWITKNDVVK